MCIRDRVTPAQTTTYRLTATGSGTTVSANLTVTVQQPTHRVVLTADSEISGFVRSSGAFTTGFVYVGDDSNNRGIQGFVTFDISSIPAGATITRVVVDMSTYEIPFQCPHPYFGCLGAYAHPYYTLYGQYRTGAVSAPIGEWCSLHELSTASTMAGFRTALQQKVGQNLFQFRLQFADMETDFDETNDLYRWPVNRLPRMTVEYTT